MKILNDMQWWYVSRLALIAGCLSSVAFAQQTPGLTLDNCFRAADETNMGRQAGRLKIKAAQADVSAAKNAYLPKVDFLASYNYLSRPLEVNLEQVREGVVEGSSQQSVNTANTIYKQITGNDLPPNIQNNLYETSRSIIGAIYPNYNPPLAAQSYLLAGIGVRQPIYLGSKLQTAEGLAQNNLTTSTLTAAATTAAGDLGIALAYFRILHLNQLLALQQNIVKAFEKNEAYAASLVKNELLPPYQKSWVSVALQQANTNLANQQLELSNAKLVLHQLIGAAVTDSLPIYQVLPEPLAILPSLGEQNFSQNPTLQLLSQKESYLKTVERLNKSTNRPNLFAIGNFNLYQKDLPATLPPWLVGLEMQWTLFNGFQTKKRSTANAMQLEAAVVESRHHEEQLATGAQICLNKMQGLKNQYNSLGLAVTEAKRTTQLIEERMKNQLSSPKDVNEAWLVQLELEKAQSLTQLGYFMALAEYYHLTGNTRQITSVLPQSK